MNIRIVSIVLFFSSFFLAVAPAKADTPVEVRGGKITFQVPRCRMRNFPRACPEPIGFKITRDGKTYSGVLTRQQDRNFPVGSGCDFTLVSKGNGAYEVTAYKSCNLIKK
jgi:hypothetical protein